ncbi:MAG: hypothetical protein RQ745_09855 [Longimicrobiales bacterium]|nr:hypothetical protein [Longimicrobiales bacterium]
MTQHSGLSAERWAEFDAPHQLLMIANEMNRIRKLPDEDRTGRQRALARVLRLTDLTLDATRRRGLRRELARWRDLAAVLYLQDDADREGFLRAFRALLLLHPVTARQIPLLIGG